MTINLFSEIKNLTLDHATRCKLYSEYIQTLFPDYKDCTSLEEIPWLPVRAFKQYDLFSISQDSIFKIMNSSGTTGIQSRIYLDQETARLQQAKLIASFQSYFGRDRYPMLIIDTESTIKYRKQFSARTAAINGFSVFSRGREFALNDELEIEIDRVVGFLKKHSGKKVFIFGFTFIIWENFIKKIQMLKLDFDFSNSFLVHGGGWKKLENKKVSPVCFNKNIFRAIKCKNIHNYYGLIEQTGSIYIECENGNLHAPEGAEAMIRGKNDFRCRGYNEEGLIQLFSNIQKSYPGHSLLTEDIGYTLPGSSCDCGRKGTILKVKGRLEKAEARGCSDAVNQ